MTLHLLHGRNPCADLPLAFVLLPLHCRLGLANVGSGRVKPCLRVAAHTGESAPRPEAQTTCPAIASGADCREEVSPKVAGGTESVTAVSLPIAAGG